MSNDTHTHRGRRYQTPLHVSSSSYMKRMYPPPHTQGATLSDARAGWVVIQSIIQGSPAEECGKLHELDHIRKVR